ncbi:hypothetical protein HNQ35_000591 [Cerasibacillus quisquiliarum]|uniref:Uncharacterized protein n=1 Tax=Cerasibacillus quisquiliarum TaxID=227865 RepID=A0A511UYW9_9BACI|nr:hypothetical protein [Cerasibacillus quisquiliarum]MBB5145399.1 hypothetical protein [Cerasibacillus quisquiliarum]GEN31835.1 hypothetical protein CQU01_20730 [Cerasibacillus quisquiliarum]
MNDVQDNQTTSFQELEDNQCDTNNSESPDEIDILNLPPRSVVHQDNHKTRIKFKQPLLRFLSVVIILLILIGVHLIIN